MMTKTSNPPPIQWVRKIDDELDMHLRYLYHLTEEQQKRWAAALKRHRDKLKQDVTEADIRMAVEGGSPDTVLDRMAWSEADAAFVVDSGALLAQQLEVAAKAEINRLRLDMRFDLDNPYVFQWIDSHAAELVTQVSNETKKAIAAVIRGAFEQGDPPRKAAMAIRPLVGLTERDSKAVMNYWRTVASDGNRTARTASDMADTYGRRLHRRRAELIARTETINASAAGSRFSFEQAQAQGLTLPGSMQEWIAAVESKRTCPRCLAMDGQRVPIGQPFQSDIGPIMGPTLHPACRCAVSLYTEIPS